MLQLGEIQAINGNKATVRVPVFEYAGRDMPYNIESIISYQPGNLNSYKVGDVVIVGFENSHYGKGIILGKLYQGLTETQDSPRTFSYNDSLTVTGTTNLSEDTTIGKISYSDLVEAVGKTGEYASSGVVTQSELAKKQDVLITGKGIKTVDGQDVLGEGNLDTSDMPNIIFTGASIVSAGSLNSDTTMDFGKRRGKDCVMSLSIVVENPETLQVGDEVQFCNGTVSHDKHLLRPLFTQILTQQDINFLTKNTVRNTGNNKCLRIKLDESKPHQNRLPEDATYINKKKNYLFWNKFSYNHTGERVRYIRLIRKVYTSVPVAGKFEVTCIKSSNIITVTIKPTSWLTNDNYKYSYIIKES